MEEEEGLSERDSDGGREEERTWVLLNQCGCFSWVCINKGGASPPQRYCSWSVGTCVHCQLFLNLNESLWWWSQEETSRLAKLAHKEGGDAYLAQWLCNSKQKMVWYCTVSLCLKLFLSSYLSGYCLKEITLWRSPSFDALMWSCRVELVFEHYVRRAVF